MKKRYTKISTSTSFFLIQRILKLIFIKFPETFSKMRLRHGLHMVSPSEWPFFISLSVTGLLGGLVLYFHNYSYGEFIFVFSLFSTVLILAIWTYVVFYEGFLERVHTKVVRRGLRLGFKLFVVSEVLFFFSFFWAYFHSALVPSFDMGWPQKGLIPWGINFLVMPTTNNVVEVQPTGFLDKLILYFTYGLRTKPEIVYGFNDRFCFNLYVILDKEDIGLEDRGLIFLGPAHIELYKINMTTLFGRDHLKITSARINWYVNIALRRAVKSGLNYENMLFTLMLSSQDWVSVFKWKTVPLLNTFILLTSGAAVTWAHHALKERDWVNALEGLIITVLLGIFFTKMQYQEYLHLPFAINDGIYGSLFYMATGFHGLHVLIGTIFILAHLIKLYYNVLDPKHHVGFQCAIWYWHFVDIVWIFLFICVYIWGGNNKAPEYATLFLKIMDFLEELGLLQEDMQKEDWLRKKELLELDNE